MLKSPKRGLIRGEALIQGRVAYLGRYGISIMSIKWDEISRYLIHAETPNLDHYIIPEDSDEAFISASNSASS